jgi:hypothetical protein
MAHKSYNERAELEMTIKKYRSLARRVVHNETAQRINVLIVELEQKIRETSKAASVEHWVPLVFIAGPD